MAGPALVARYGELIGAVLPNISHSSRDIQTVGPRAPRGARRRRPAAQRSTSGRAATCACALAHAGK